MIPLEMASECCVIPTRRQGSNLFVADAATFPHSSGVNPMITIMAIADHVAQGLAGER